MAKPSFPPVHVIRIDQRPPAIFLMGPTASGKTALALQLAQRFALDLISVDSALVYRGMDIGTAKPDAATLAKFPHRLIDIRDPSQPYSAAEFSADARREMAAITQAGRIPLLVGGTSLYFRILQKGLSDLPEANAAIREQLACEAGTLGWTALHARLLALDPVAGARIKPGDSQRIQRALEVIALTGKSLTEQQGARAWRFEYRVLKLALIPADRAALHERIVLRMDTMLDQGFLAEMKDLRARGDLAADMPSMRAVGYRQAWEHLDGVCAFAEFREKAVFATRQLAKRQMTWLRSDLDAVRLEPFDRRHESRAERLLDDFFVGF